MEENFLKDLISRRDAAAKLLRSLDETIHNYREFYEVKANGVSSSNGVHGNNKEGQPTDKGQDQIKDTKYKGYASLKSYRDKVTFIFKTENRFLHIREIIGIAQSLEKQHNGEEMVDSLRQAVYGLKAKDVLVSYKVDGRNINAFWGSKNWLDDDGNVKPEHAYNNDQITTNEPVEI